jgi:hypothetical protein
MDHRAGGLGEDAPMKRIAVLFVLPFLSFAAEPKKPAHVPVAAIAPRPEDVATIDGIVKAYYDVVTVAAGAPRPWDRDRTLYIKDVRFVSNHVGKDGKPVATVMSHQDYVDRTDPGLAKEGFDEHEIHRTTQRFGNIAHVFSTYESRKTPGGPVIARGINSLELFWDGSRWWIAAAIWDDERADNPIPKEYLP